MLAMDANDDAGVLNARGALGFFASKPAPTGNGALLPRQITRGDDHGSS
jgi:hypothetical protein